jgi:hypothetical protein
MTDAAQAFINKGARGNWPPLNNPPSFSIGFTLGHGSWPEWSAKNATTTVRLWRNPNGDLWDQPARYGTIGVWRPRIARPQWWDFLRQLEQYRNDLTAIRTPLMIPWGRGWSGAGGTQAASSDNGCIINIDADRSYEIQGLAPLNAADVLQINARALAPVASIGDYRCDGIAARAPGVRPHGSQGPWWKRDGLLRPEDLSGPWREPKRLVAFPVAYGASARAAAGAWVEHKGAIPAYEGLPPEGHPDLIPCGTRFLLDITDYQIEQWIMGEGVDTLLADSMRWFAKGLRSQGMRLMESGTGVPFIESTGGTVPAERSAWAARGITDEVTANRLGRNIWRYGKLRVA